MRSLQIIRPSIPRFLGIKSLLHPGSKTLLLFWISCKMQLKKSKRTSRTFTKGKSIAKSNKGSNSSHYNNTNTNNHYNNNNNNSNRRLKSRKRSKLAMNRKKMRTKGKDCNRRESFAQSALQSHREFNNKIIK